MLLLSSCSIGLSLRRFARRTAPPIQSIDSIATQAVDFHNPGLLAITGGNLFIQVTLDFNDWEVSRSAVDLFKPQESTIDVTLHVESITSGNAVIDRRILSGEFFDVETYPTASILLRDPKRVLGSEEENPDYIAQAEITLNGIQGEAVFKGRNFLSWPIIVSGELIILRSDFNIGVPHNRLNPISIEDEVILRIDVNLIRSD